MKRVFTGVIIIFCVLLLVSGCGDKDDVTKFVNITKTAFVDTLLMSTVKSTGTYTADSVVSDTVTATQDLFTKIITTQTVFDTNFIISCQVESTIVAYEVCSVTVTDTIPADLAALHSDTIKTVLDTIWEITLLPLTPLTVTKDTVITTCWVDTQQISRWVVTTTSDSTNGNVAMEAASYLLSSSTIKKALLPIHWNNALFTYNEALYIAAGPDRDTIIKNRGPVVSSSSIDYKYAFGDSADIRKIAFVDETKAYIIARNNKKVKIFNPRAGNISGSVDLSAYALHAGTDSAQIPFAADGIIKDSKLYVLCQRLKKTQTGITVSEAPGLIVIVSTQNDSVLDTVSLQGKNPCTMDLYGDYLYVSFSGTWQSGTDGGIEKVDLLKDSSSGIVLSETDVGNANITKMIMINSSKGYLIAHNGVPGTVAAKLYVFVLSPSVQVSQLNIADNVSDITYDGIYVYVGDRKSSNHGLYIVNPATNASIVGPINVGSEPPNAITVLFAQHLKYQTN